MLVCVLFSRLILIIILEFSFYYCFVLLLLLLLLLLLFFVVTVTCIFFAWGHNNPWKVTLASKHLLVWWWDVLHKEDELMMLSSRNRLSNFTVSTYIFHYYIINYQSKAIEWCASRVRVGVLLWIFFTFSWDVRGCLCVRTVNVYRLNVRVTCEHTFFFLTGP